MGILLTTQYGEVVLSRHAVDRWRQRTERSLPELVAAVATARRPSKKIQQRDGFQPKRILECEHAYFIIENQVIVTVYHKKKEINHA
ncbi:TPA: hypothetical protein I6Z16_001377 [Vibrio cholerae]|nr:hypothetical protein [Vibrio cholerae]